MTEQERLSLQDDLSVKLHKNPYTDPKKHSPRMEDGYKEGILAAKNAVSVSWRSALRGNAKMTEHEYRSLQEDLSEKLRKNPFSNPKQHTIKMQEGYEEGILAAKSVLSAFYKAQYRR